MPTPSGWFPHRDHFYLAIDENKSSISDGVFYAYPTFVALKKSREYEVLKNVSSAFTDWKKLRILWKLLVVILDWDSTHMASVVTDNMRAELNSWCTYRDFQDVLQAQDFKHFITI